MFQRTVASAASATGHYPAAGGLSTLNFPGSAEGRDQMTTFLSIAGGTARTAQWQVSFDGTTWFNVGTSRTAIGDFVELVPKAPFIRLNVSANTGSAFTAGVAV